MASVRREARQQVGYGAVEDEGDHSSRSPYIRGLRDRLNCAYFINSICVIDCPLQEDGNANKHERLVAPYAAGDDGLAAVTFLTVCPLDKHDNECNRWCNQS